MSADTFIPADATEITLQVGLFTLLAISGGRVYHRETGITMPVSNGYRVTVDLDASDTYVVRRVFKRGDKVWIKREWTDVYAEDLHEIAYRASCFRDA